jgi:hypothetical protein
MQNVISPGWSVGTPSSREISWHPGSNIDDAVAMFMTAALIPLAGTGSQSPNPGAMNGSGSRSLDLHYCIHILRF